MSGLPLTLWISSTRSTCYMELLQNSALKQAVQSCLQVQGVPFPKNFMSVAKTILKRLFRVYAHIYHQHFDSVMQLQEEAHLNTSFKHFIFFVQEFNLIDRRELAPLQELIEKLGSKDR